MGIQENLDGDVILWRYMDLSKLLAILVNKELIFPRFDKFEDKFEGYPDNYLDHVKSSYMDNIFLNMAGEYKGYLETGLIRNLIKVVNYTSYVSCWHINEHESAAMWKLYCTSSDSIAIKTTVGKLKEALADHNERLSFGKIIYDFKYEKLEKIQKINLSDPLFTKQESFDHEKEFRIIYRDYEKLESRKIKMEKDFNEFHSQNKSNGCYDKLTNEIKKLLESGKYFDTSSNENLNILFFNELKEEKPFVEPLKINPIGLIDEIIISPTAASWFFKTVKAVLKELGYKDIKIKKSKLNELN